MFILILVFYYFLGYENVIGEVFDLKEGLLGYFLESFFKWFLVEGKSFEGKFLRVRNCL